MSETFSDLVKDIIRNIPRGRVITYGLIATIAGNPRGARQVVRILHSCSESDDLPWHRVVNRSGAISLKPGHGYELQKSLLKREGVHFNSEDRIDLSRFLWSPRK